MLPRAVAPLSLVCAVAALSACTAVAPESGVQHPVRSATAPTPDQWAGHFDARAAELGGSGGEHAVSADLDCPCGASLPITTDVAGLTVSIDSHGQPGAYLIAIDAGAASG